jgi:hypothetical protein
MGAGASRDFQRCWGTSLSLFWLLGLAVTAFSQSVIVVLVVVFVVLVNY